MRTLDELIARSKKSQAPLHLVSNSDLPHKREEREPTDAECKILMAVQFHAASLETAGRIGDLACFMSRLDYEVKKMKEALK